mmetsp:Transcript_77483/g.177439  ORF Transcript_77483/g.177439 Transcript_77483/m.177439 type:complete len:656 (-) Transcript_77483:657-2624(-)
MLGTFQQTRCAGRARAPRNCGHCGSRSVLRNRSNDVSGCERSHFLRLKTARNNQSQSILLDLRQTVVSADGDHSTLRLQRQLPALRHPAQNRSHVHHVWDDGVGSTLRRCDHFTIIGDGISVTTQTESDVEAVVGIASTNASSVTWAATFGKASVVTALDGLRLVASDMLDFNRSNIMSGHSPLRIHLRHQALDWRRLLTRGQTRIVWMNAPCVSSRQGRPKTPPPQYRIFGRPPLALATLKISQPSENRYNMCNRKTNLESAEMFKFRPIHDTPLPRVHGKENVSQRLEPAGCGRRHEKLHGHGDRQRNILQILTVGRKPFGLLHSWNASGHWPVLRPGDLTWLIVRASCVWWGASSRRCRDGGNTLSGISTLDPGWMSCERSNANECDIWRVCVGLLPSRPSQHKISSAFANSDCAISKAPLKLVNASKHVVNRRQPCFPNHLTAGQLAQMASLPALTVRADRCIASPIHRNSDTHFPSSRPLPIQWMVINTSLRSTQLSQDVGPFSDAARRTVQYLRQHCSIEQIRWGPSRQGSLSIRLGRSQENSQSGIDVKAKLDILPHSKPIVPQRFLHPILDSRNQIQVGERTCRMLVWQPGKRAARLLGRSPMKCLLQHAHQMARKKSAGSAMQLFELQSQLFRSASRQQKRPNSRE